MLHSLITKKVTLPKAFMTLFNFIISLLILSEKMVAEAHPVPSVSKNDTIKANTGISIGSPLNFSASLFNLFHRFL